jgi:predicted nucleotidyltransferase
MDIQARLRSHLASHPEAGVAGIWLFGSAAQGRMHRESDVDVAVLYDRRILPAALDRARASELLAGSLMQVLARNDLDVLVLNDTPPLLARRIVTEGIELLVADADLVHSFRRDTLLRAADVAPFVERGRRRLLEELRR